MTRIQPDSGPTAGGTTVTITGTGFSCATAVMFGTAAATNVTVFPPRRSSAVDPAGTGTEVGRHGSTSAGRHRRHSAADKFTYTAVIAPTVTAISPSSGPAAGGTTVTITGTGLSGATAVKFGTVAATSVSVVAATQVTGGRSRGHRHGSM